MWKWYKTLNGGIIMKKTARIISLLLIVALLAGCAISAIASGTKEFITTGTCNMRKEPNKDSKKVAELPKKTVIKATDFREDSRGVTWYFAGYKGKTGWISEKNLKPHSGGSPEKTPKPHEINKISLKTTGECYMRSQPNTSADKITKLPLGVIVTSKKYQKDSRGVRWYYTSYEGDKGWVSEVNLKIYSEKKTPKPTAKPTNKPHEINKISLKTTGSCYMRSAADKNSDKITTLPVGVIVTSKKYQKDDRGVRWYYTSYDGEKGWVSEVNLKIYSDKKTPEPTNKPHEINKISLKTTGSCHMRKAADKDSAKVLTLPAGVIITSKKYQKDDRGVRWYYTTYNDRKGWVSEANLKIYSQPTPAPTPRPIDYDSFYEAGYRAVVNVNSLNVRMAPSSDYSVIEVLNNGAVVYCVRTNGTWTEIEDRVNNRHGYVFADYLTRIDEPKVIETIEEPVNPADIEDGTYHAAFDPAFLANTESGLQLRNIELFTMDKYAIDDIEGMNVGDEIVIEGREVKVEAVERGDAVKINGGFDNEGYDLVVRDGDDFYTILMWDDAATYTGRAVVSLYLDNGFTFSDDANIDQHVSGDITNFASLIANDQYGFVPDNTMIKIVNNRIAAITRIYTP